MDTIPSPDNTPHLCECGCGQTTRLASRTNTCRNVVKGQPQRFIQGHSGVGQTTHLPSHEARFWARTDRSGGPDACWLWKGTTSNLGYGVMHWKNGYMGAHRISYILAHGSIPDGLLIRHTCDNPGCVNPAHLIPGTPADNSRDAVERHRIAAADTHPHSKLTWEDVRYIREQHANHGTSAHKLAREKGISVTHCCNILRGKTWRE